MKIRKITTRLMTFAALSAPLQATASTGSCSAGLTTNPVQFESALWYDDMQSKANPTVHVWINGKLVKMVLDSGSNLHSLWDESLLDETSSSRFERLDTIGGSVDVRTVKATLADAHGNALPQEFYVLASPALAEDGYSGILSPQALAGDNAVVIDFDKNCFFTGLAFDIGSDNGLHVRRGTTIQNPHDVMAISVELDGSKIPVIVDSGAPSTLIQASLVASRPKGRKSPGMMDANKTVLANADHMRLVDLKVNGQIFKSLPVIPRQTKDEKGVVNLGYIGMDVLKDRVIYYDRTQQEFTLATRQKTAQPPVSERKTHTD